MMMMMMMISCPPHICSCGWEKGVAGLKKYWNKVGFQCEGWMFCFWCFVKQVEFEAAEKADLEAFHLGRLPLKLTKTKEVQWEEWENIVNGLDILGSQEWKAGDKLLGSDPPHKVSAFSWSHPCSSSCVVPSRIPPLQHSMVLNFHTTSAIRDYGYEGFRVSWFQQQSVGWLVACWTASQHSFKSHSFESKCCWQVWICRFSGDLVRLSLRYPSEQNLTIWFVFSLFLLHMVFHVHVSFISFQW